MYIIQSFLIQNKESDTNDLSAALLWTMSALSDPRLCPSVLTELHKSLPNQRLQVSACCCVHCLFSSVSIASHIRQPKEKLLISSFSSVQLDSTWRGRWPSVEIKYTSYYTNGGLKYCIPLQLIQKVTQCVRHRCTDKSSCNLFLVWLMFPAKWYKYAK